MIHHINSSCKRVFAAISSLFLMTNVVSSAQPPESSISFLSTENVLTQSSLCAAYSPSLSLYSEGNTFTYNDYQTYSLNLLNTIPLKDSKLPIMVETGFGVSLLHYTKTSNITGNLVSIKVPGNVLFALTLSPDLAIYPYAGLYCKLNPYGRESYEVTTSDGVAKKTVNLLDKKDMGNNVTKVFLVGYQAGVRIRYSRYFAMIEYESSMMNLTTNAKYRLTSFGIGLMFQ